jgi:hypothetical protein
MPLYAVDQWTWCTRGAWRMMSRFIGVQFVWHIWCMARCVVGDGSQSMREERFVRRTAISVQTEELKWWVGCIPRETNEIRVPQLSVANSVSINR